jgi:voltage-gated potassium channel
MTPPPAAPPDHPLGRPRGGWRLALYRVIFESDTPAGRRFDVVLVVLILASVFAVILDSVVELQHRWDLALHGLEWFFTAAFTLEYLLRLVCVRRPMRYARSFFGVIDLLAVLPTWLAVLVPGVQALLDVRVLRLLRIFRIFKLTAFVSEYQVLIAALAASWRKILVFLSTVLFIVIVMGTVMYVLEGPGNGFSSIPLGIYWAITTMTTVGFGDLTPHTAGGRLIASLMMLIGWGTLAVPTGIVTAEMAFRRRSSARPHARSSSCPACGEQVHLPQAAYCHRCGTPLSRP